MQSHFEAAKAIDHEVKIKKSQNHFIYFARIVAANALEIYRSSPTIATYSADEIDEAILKAQDPNSTPTRLIIVSLSEALKIQLFTICTNSEFTEVEEQYCAPAEGGLLGRIHLSFIEGVWGTLYEGYANQADGCCLTKDNAMFHNFLLNSKEIEDLKAQLLDRVQPNQAPAASVSEEIKAQIPHSSSQASSDPTVHNHDSIGLSQSLASYSKGLPGQEHPTENSHLSADHANSHISQPCNSELLTGIVLRLLDLYNSSYLSTPSPIAYNNFIESMSQLLQAEVNLGVSLPVPLAQLLEVTTDKFSQFQRASQASQGCVVCHGELSSLINHYPHFCNHMCLRCLLKVYKTGQVVCTHCNQPIWFLQETMKRVMTQCQECNQAFNAISNFTHHSEVCDACISRRAL